ncbi:hypothetical protein VIGAN_09196000, partial [Vigna angularis var. angularis]
IIISRVSITKTKLVPSPTPHPPRFQIPTHPFTKILSSQTHRHPTFRDQTSCPPFSQSQTIKPNNPQIKRNSQP